MGWTCPKGRNRWSRLPCRREKAYGANCDPCRRGGEMFGGSELSRYWRLMDVSGRSLCRVSHKANQACSNTCLLLGDAGFIALSIGLILQRKSTFVCSRVWWAEFSLSPAGERFLKEVGAPQRSSCFVPLPIYRKAAAFYGILKSSKQLGRGSELFPRGTWVEPRYPARVGVPDWSTRSPQPRYLMVAESPLAVVRAWRRLMSGESGNWKASDSAQGLSWFSMKIQRMCKFNPILFSMPPYLSGKACLPSLTSIQSWCNGHRSSLLLFTLSRSLSFSHLLWYLQAIMNLHIDLERTLEGDYHSSPRYLNAFAWGEGHISNHIWS